MNLLKKIAVWVITFAKLKELPRNRRVSYSAMIYGSVTVGDYSYIGGGTEIRGVCGSIEIGRYCSIGRDVKILAVAQSHRPNGLSTYPFFQIDQSLLRKNFLKPLDGTSIGHDVWIGSNSIIMPGLKIGTGAIIGAGAVVTKDVPPYAIVAGVPAKMIGVRHTANVVEILLAGAWWEKEYRDLKHTFGDLITSGRELKVGDIS